MLLYDVLYENDIDYVTEELYLAQCVANNIKVKSTDSFADKKDIIQAKAQTRKEVLEFTQKFQKLVDAELENSNSALSKIISDQENKYE